MAIAATISILVLILGIVIFALLTLLQIYLSRKENKWLGLILPGIHLVISIVVMVYSCMFTMALMSYGSTTTVTVQAEEIGALPEEEIAGASVPGTDTNEDTVYQEDSSHSYESDAATETEYADSNFSFNILFSFLCLNIPTIVDMIIYVICRKRINKKSDIEKMKLQDL